MHAEVVRWEADGGPPIEVETMHWEGDELHCEARVLVGAKIEEGGERDGI